MKKLYIIFIIAFLAACRKDEFNPDQVKTFSIQSIATGANYTIDVACPANYDPANHSYATIYVLDSEENFNYVAKQCNKISGDHSTSYVLVVGIGHGRDRSLDYTPTLANEGGGGAEAFMHFIQDELIPRIEQEYGAAPDRSNRVILGHSFGGLFAAYAFTNFNDVFGNYLMLSPSIWYDDEVLMRYEREHRNANKNSEQLVFMGLGGLESSGRMMAPFEAFHQTLQNNYPNMKLSKHIEPQLEHSGSKNPNIQKGLNYYFENRQ